MNAMRRNATKCGMSPDGLHEAFGFISTSGTRRARAGPLSCQPTLGKSPAVSEGDEESSEASEELYWPDDGSLSASDRSHITAGLWAIDTINANAWPGTLEFLLASAADFVAAQECRIRSEQCAEKEASARSSKWCVSLEPCIITEAGSTSSGVAIGARSHIGVAAPATATGCYSTVLHGRFCLRRIGAVCRGGFHLGSVYLHDTVGVMAANNLDLLQEVAAELALVCGGWVVGGDWNCTPAELAATGWLDLVGGAICAPQAATCNGNVYDFFVVKRQFQHAVHSVQLAMRCASLTVLRDCLFGARLAASWYVALSDLAALAPCSRMALRWRPRLSVLTRARRLMSRTSTLTSMQSIASSSHALRRRCLP